MAMASAVQLEQLVIPVKKSQLEAATAARVAVDSGAQLHKILFVSELDDEHYSLHCLLTGAEGLAAGLEAVRTDCRLLRLDASDCVKVTGLGYQHESLVRQVFGVGSEFVVEALCWIRGCCWAVQHLQPEHIFYPREQPDPCFCKSASSCVLDRIQHNLKVADSSEQQQFPAVLVNAGSSISMCIVNDRQEAVKMSMCFFSCKTLLGLAALLVGTGDYTELMRLAEAGDRGNVDLCVDELTAADPLHPLGCCRGDMPLLHLAKLADSPDAARVAARADVARSLVSLFCHNLFGNVVAFATAAGVGSVYLGGNFFRSRLVRKEFENAKAFLLRDAGFRHRFLSIGGHLGCLGALVSDNGMASAVLKFAA